MQHRHLMNASFASNNTNLNITGFLNQFLQCTMAMVLQLFMCYPDPPDSFQPNIADTISVLEQTHATLAFYAPASAHPNTSCFPTEPPDTLPRERDHGQGFHAGHHQHAQSGPRHSLSPQTFVPQITASVHEHSSVMETSANCDLQPWARPKKPPVPIAHVTRDCHQARNISAQSSMS